MNPYNQKPTGRPMISSMTVAEIDEVKAIVLKYRAQGLITIRESLTPNQIDKVQRSRAIESNHEQKAEDSDHPDVAPIRPDAV